MLLLAFFLTQCKASLLELLTMFAGVDLAFATRDFALFRYRLLGLRGRAPLLQLTCRLALTPLGITYQFWRADIT